MTSRILLFLSFGFFQFTALACSPCGALSNVTQTINGNNLELTFTSNAGWECCYTVQIEIVCTNAAFTGIPNYQSAQVCIGSGTASSTTNPTPTPYPLTVIDISNFCPGTYKWRAAETGCYIYTPEYTFTVGGGAFALDVSASQESICVGDNTNLSAVVSNVCQSGQETYSWTPVSGLSNPNIANPVATPGTTTTYTCTVSYQGNCGMANASSNVTINVSNYPDASVSGSTEVCLGDPEPEIVFTGSNSTGPYTINYQLNGGSSTSIIANNTAIVNVPTNVPGTYTYSLIDVTESSSAACSQSVNSTATVIVHDLPAVAAGSDLVICEQNPSSPTQITLSGSGALNYVWDNGVQDGVPFVPPIGITVYTVVGTDANGCSNTDNVEVSYHNVPIVDAGQDIEICEPNPNSPSEVTLSASGAVTYVWDNGVQDGVPFVPPLGITQYTVTGTDANGCSNTDMVQVTSYPQPTANGSASIVFGNLPLAVTFSNLSVNGNQFTWDFGDGSVITTFSAGSVDHVFNDPGIFTVTLTASNGICYDVWTIEIEVLPPMEVLVPNVFTPNGDGANDFFLIDVNYGAGFEAEIFNRWGNEISTLTHIDQGWDGRSAGHAVNEGVYFIKYRAVDYQGYEIQGHCSFTLIR